MTERCNDFWERAVVLQHARRSQCCTSTSSMCCNAPCKYTSVNALVLCLCLKIFQGYKARASTIQQAYNIQCCISTSSECCTSVSSACCNFPCKHAPVSNLVLSLCHMIQSCKVRAWEFAASQTHPLQSDLLESDLLHILQCSLQAAVGILC